MNYNVPATINEQAVIESASAETPATAAEAGHGSCSGHGHQGCCGSHRQEASPGHSHHAAQGCCGH
jgi:hypothetical protein